MTTPRRSWGAGLMRFAGLGIQFACWVGLLAFAGHQCDLWLDTRPFLLIAGCLLGAAGGMWDVIRTVGRWTRSVERAEEQQQEDPPDRPAGTTGTG